MKGGDNLILRNNLKLVAKNRGYSMRRLARETGVPLTYVCGFGSGRIVPTDVELEAYAKALGVTADLLIPDQNLLNAMREDLKG